MNGRVESLANVETEHLLSATTHQGKAVLRVVSETGTVVLGHLTPAQAREIASHLSEAAARCEYEQDLFTELTIAGLEESAIGMVMHAVRAGEMRRATATGEG